MKKWKEWTEPTKWAENKDEPEFRSTNTRTQYYSVGGCCSSRAWSCAFAAASAASHRQQHNLASRVSSFRIYLLLVLVLMAVLSIRSWVRLPLKTVGICSLMACRLWPQQRWCWWCWLYASTYRLASSLRVLLGYVSGKAQLRVLSCWERSFGNPRRYEAVGLFAIAQPAASSSNLIRNMDSVEGKELNRMNGK